MITLPSGESKPKRTGTPFRCPVGNAESVPRPENVNIRTETVVLGPQWRYFKLRTISLALAVYRTVGVICRFCNGP